MADKRSAVVALLLVLAGVAAAFVVSPQPASSSSSSSRARGCSAAVAMKAGSNSGGIGSRQASIASRREALLAGVGSVLASGVLLGSLPKPAEAASAASTYYPQVGVLCVSLSDSLGVVAKFGSTHSLPLIDTLPK